MRVVVTGAAGGIGRWVVAHLVTRGHEVVAVDRAAPGTARPGTGGQRPATPPDSYSTGPVIPDDGVSWHLGDVRDPGLLSRAVDGAHALIHLAAIPAPTLGTAYEVFATNTQATFTALEAAGQAGVSRVAIASSISLLGLPYAPTPLSPLSAPIPDDHPNIGSDPYALSKECDEATLRLMHRRFGYQAVALRISGVAPLAWFEEQRPAIEADPGTLANELWAYLDSRDAARAFALAVERDIPGVHAVNVMAPDIRVKTHTSAELMARYHPSTSLTRPLVSRETLFDLSRARELLGFTAQHRLFPERSDP
jgi:nucleoside-diphosphate-sugar epimerase